MRVGRYEGTKVRRNEAARTTEGSWILRYVTLPIGIAYVVHIHDSQHLSTSTHSSVLHSVVVIIHELSAASSPVCKQETVCSETFC